MKKIFFIITLFAFCGLLISNSTQSSELKFSHNYHVVEEELECATCHESANQSVSGKDNLLPSMETCADCHDIEDDNNCTLCHSDVDNPREVTRIEDYSAKFNHQAHLNNGLNCNDCHAAVNQKTNVEPFELPNMVFCMDCHNQQSAANECSNCHLPGESLVPSSHVLDFKHNHAVQAINENPTILNDKKCSTCHQTSFCQECHEGDNLGLQSHPMNYQFTHSLEAQGKEMDCSVCHTERSFCIECHRDNNVLPHNHTAGWANTIDGGRHKLEAEIDLESCMACHEQNAEQICQPCHGN
jgi:cytochrome c7-like protein